MNKYAGTAVLALSLTGWAAIVQARPPTVMSSPGYDARLAESRKAYAAALAAQPAPRIVVRHSRKKKSATPN